MTARETTAISDYKPRDLLSDLFKLWLRLRPRKRGGCLASNPNVDASHGELGESTTPGHDSARPAASPGASSANFRMSNTLDVAVASSLR